MIAYPMTLSQTGSKIAYHSVRFHASWEYRGGKRGTRIPSHHMSTREKMAS